MNRNEILFLENFAPKYILYKGKETRFWRIYDESKKWVDIIFDHDFKRMILFVSPNFSEKILGELTAFACTIGYQIVNYINSESGGKNHGSVGGINSQSERES